MKVKHWFNQNIYAEIHIRGLVLKKDSGVVIVSYFLNNSCVRNEKWRLSDIQQYYVAHHGMVSTTLSAVSKIFNFNNLKIRNIIAIYGKILNEKSWGLSTSMKPYGYYSYGQLVRDPLPKQTFSKFKESLSPHIIKGASLTMIIKLTTKTTLGKPQF